MKPSAALEKKLDFLSRHELTSLISSMASSRKENAQWLEMKLKGSAGSQEALAYYKKRVRDAFRASEKPDLRSARQALTDFSKASRDECAKLELMVFYVETGTKLEKEYGDMYEACYLSIESVFKDIVRRLNSTPPNRQLANEFRPRLKWVVIHCTEGYGQKEALEYWYEQLRP